MSGLQKKLNLPIPKGFGACRALLVRHIDDLRRFREEEWSYESIHQAFQECYGEPFLVTLPVFRETARRVLQKGTAKENERAQFSQARSLEKLE
ncbi:hypothetical protein [Acidomonas methanolica]|uniref:hypothetical protein n=1 Tax=Acidomonas methanolica TaxID=437 RepID=UPI00211A5425|nr:hypothetical protein [Acidomonas methanolica]MCQ9156477.1 hypothetical protein [Acidomonas methanolica]